MSTTSSNILIGIVICWAGVAFGQQDQSVLQPQKAEVDQVDQRLAAIEKQLARIDERLAHLQQVIRAPGTKLVRENTEVQPASAAQDTGANRNEPPMVAIGRLIIHNRTRNTQYVSINGKRYFLPPGESRMDVPHAPVELYLPGYENPTTWGMSLWKQNGDRHEMVLDIHP